MHCSLFQNVLSTYDHLALIDPAGAIYALALVDISNSTI